jgi:hypothetical protein
MTSFVRRRRRNDNNNNKKGKKNSEGKIIIRKRLLFDLMSNICAVIVGRAVFEGERKPN